MRAIRSALIPATVFLIPLMGQIPKATKLVLPRYPALALAAHQQGLMKVRLDLNSDGSVQHVEVLESFTKLKMAIKPISESLSLWQFEPGTKLGEPITIEFQILPWEAHPTDELIEITSSCRVLIKAREVRVEQNSGY